jgi:ribose 5-phosphate isomerase B
MKLVIGSDKGGYELKEAIKSFLKEANYEVTDVGTQDINNPIYFFETASNAAKAIQEGRADKGILVCGTGMGVSQVANKFSGILAAACESVYATKMCRIINDANILCMGGWVIGKNMGIEMTETFLNTEFTQGLSVERAEYLKNAKRLVLEVDSENRKEFVTK